MVGRSTKDIFEMRIQYVVVSNSCIKMLLYLIILHLNVVISHNILECWSSILLFSLYIVDVKYLIAYNSIS